MKRRRRPLSQVKSGIALSNLAIPTPAALSSKFGPGPLRRGHSKRSLTRINSKGMELSNFSGLLHGKDSKEHPSNGKQENQDTVVVAEGSFLTSRTARVLLAGAGFLADAVSTHNYSLIIPVVSFFLMFFIFSCFC